MKPVKPRYTIRVLATLPKAEIFKAAILDLRRTTPASLTFRPATTVARFVMLIVGLGICLLLGSHRADAAVVADASLSGVELPASIAWYSCGEQLDCARVEVPLDWDNPNGLQISLLVIRYRASKPNQRIGSLFVNYGGPGVPGVPAVREAGAGLDQLADGRFDIVGWDPRGTGESTHVTCFENTTAMSQFWGEDWTVPSGPADSWLYVPKTIAYARQCAAMSGSLLNHISTADTVRDLDYLRQLVGDAQLTYRGLSYGTFLGQTYANMFPNNVRAMILDANIDPVPFTTSVEAAMYSSGTDTNLVFKKFLVLCEQAGPANCALAGQGGVAPRVRALLKRLRLGPIPAPSAPAPHELRYGDALIEIWSTLGGPAKWPKLADELNQAANGDGSALAIPVREGRISILGSLVPATALQCADKPLLPPGSVLTWPKVIQHLTTSNFLGSVEGWWLWAPCASWKASSSERYIGSWNATTQNPILIIGNLYDPRTRYLNSVLASRRLGNAVLLTLQGYGHTSDVDPSACIDEAVTNYLVTTTTPPAGTFCQPDHAPFDPNFGKPLPWEQQLFE